jgi:uncharacterized protein (TIGR02466 family)
MEKITPFITSIWIDEISDQKNLIEHINKIKTDKHPISKSNKGGWQSKAYFEDCNSFLDLTMAEIIEKIKIVYKDMGIDQMPRLKNYWFNCNHRNDYNLVHVHPYSFVSAVLYIKTSLNCGNIVFERPDNFDHFIDGAFIHTENNIRSFYITPKNNQLIMFPSYLPHYVEKSNSDDERISLALNFG